MSGARRLTIYEPFRSIFYAPQFVALYGGHFAGEDLDVEVRTAGGGTTTTGALIDGHAEIALGGIMRSLDVADRGGPLLPHFAQVNQRNGFFLLSRALSRAQRWMAGVDGKQIADVIAPAFSDITSDVRHRAVARYLEQDTWARGPMLDRPGYEYLQAILLDGGFIRRPHRYEDLIDTTIARQVVGERRS